VSDCKGEERIFNNSDIECSGNASTGKNVGVDRKIWDNGKR
jgi:hypothetical protein